MLLASLCLMALLATIVLGPCGSGDETADPWQGSWHEIGTPEAYVLRITPDSAGDSAGDAYTVLYRRSFLVPFSAHVKDGQLIIWGENTKDVVWTVTYDQGADTLTAVGNQGTFHFRRVKK